MLHEVRLLEGGKPTDLFKLFVEGSFGWLPRFRRLARDYERFAETLAGQHFVAFACLMPA